MYVPPNVLNFCTHAYVTPDSRQTNEALGKRITPPVTARFDDINEEDNTLRGYKNYDVSPGKPRDVKVY